MEITTGQHEALALARRGMRLDVLFTRPERRNAMSAALNREMRALFAALVDDRSVRLVVLRGAGGWFCSGGDMRERDQSLHDPNADPRVAARERNRLGGELFRAVNHAPQVVVAVVEGAAMGGGFGLACAADITLARPDAQFAMPEASIGVAPAQIAPYVVRRLGLSQARRLALTAARIDGREAAALGLAHHLCEDDAAIEARLAEIERAVRRCGPGALAGTKRVLNAASLLDDAAMIEFAAEVFADCVTTEEGIEGTRSFLEKRRPAWAGEA